MIRASVIIPALNEAQNLACNLPAVLSQLGPKDEILVVDNGSVDDTAKVALSMGAKVIYEHVRGRSHARNKGLEASSGELVVFLDADCRPHPDWLVNLVNAFCDANVGCVAGEIEVHHGNKPLGQYLNTKAYLTQRVNFQHPFLPFAGSGNVAFRRSVLNKIGSFDEGLFSGHDADICWRMQLQTNFKILLCAEAIVDHFQVLTPRALIRQKRRHGYGSVLLYKKYRRYRQHERKSVKHAYWEYRSIIRRVISFALQSVSGKSTEKAEICSISTYQLFLEIADKLGKLEGCVRKRVWFP